MDRQSWSTRSTAPPPDRTPSGRARWLQPLVRLLLFGLALWSMAALFEGSLTTRRPLTLAAGALAVGAVHLALQVGWWLSRSPRLGSRYGRPSPAPRQFERCAAQPGAFEMIANALQKRR